MGAARDRLAAKRDDAGLAQTRMAWRPHAHRRPLLRRQRSAFSRVGAPGRRLEKRLHALWPRHPLVFASSLRRHPGSDVGPIRSFGSLCARKRRGISHIGALQTRSRFDGQGGMERELFARNGHSLFASECSFRSPGRLNRHGAFSALHGARGRPFGLWRNSPIGRSPSHVEVTRAAPYANNRQRLTALPRGRPLLFGKVFTEVDRPEQQGSEATSTPRDYSHRHSFALRSLLRQRIIKR